MKKFEFLILFCVFSFASFTQILNTTLTYSVYKPTVKSVNPPLLILLHGYGSDEADLFSLAPQLDGRFLTISLRAPNKRQGGGYCWYEIKPQQNGEFLYDYTQAKKSRDNIMSFISEACRVYKLDSTRVCLIGFSQGAIMSYEIAIYAPKKVKALIPLSGRLMKESKEHNSSIKDLSKLSFFIGHGLSDEVIKINESEKAESFLKASGVQNITFNKYPMSHNISQEEVKDIKNWLSQTFK